MKATLLETNNEEVVDLIGSTHDLIDQEEPFKVDFADLLIDCKKGGIKSLPGNRVELTSIWGYKYLFQIL